MKYIYIYTRYGLALGGVGIALMEILKRLNELDGIKLKLIVEKELFFESDLTDKVPHDVEIMYLKNQNAYENLFLVKKMKEILTSTKSSKTKILIIRSIDRIINRINVKNTLKNENIDILIDFDMSLCGKIKMIKALKKIVWIHNYINIYPWYSWKNNVKHYDNIVVTCEESKKTILENNKTLGNKIVKLYNLIDFDRVIKLSLQNFSLNELNFIKDKYIISVMRLDSKQKDFDTLIGAHKLLKKKGIKVKHYIIGGGPDKHYIEEKLIENNLNNELILLGSKENPYPWIKNSLFLVHSSKYEGMAIVLVEAMILEVPVISTSCPVGPSDVLDHGKQGVLVKMGDPSDLAQAIHSMLFDKKSREEFKKKNKEWLNEFHSSKSLNTLKNVLDLN
ncbi:glycosyltransferase [uncultured Ilyobacter sp.]|uniref:glycosyltransferase n=1 Tax=uncultured Ilyobacter sp. TaxID=544433 RepID=UPI0029F4798E|nr:glycosyltransferase [uncultured Ilyobacter sp.]